MGVSVRKKKIKDGRLSIYLDIYENGVRKTETLKLYLYEKPKNQAEKNHNKEIQVKVDVIRNRTETELLNNRYKFLGVKDSQINFLDYFQTLTEQRKKSKGNYDNWNSTYKILLTYYQGKSIKLSDLEDSDLNDIRNYIKDKYLTKSGKKLSTNAASSYFNKVKASLNQAFDEKLLNEKIGARVKSIKPEDTHREYLIESEIAEIKKHDCHFPVLKRAFLFSVYTGLRWSDINNLKWGDIRKSTEGFQIVYRQQKTGTQDTLHLNSQALQYIGERDDSTAKVFKGLKYSGHHNLKLSQWMMKAQITKNITFHSARHTFATSLITKNASVYTLSKILGHKNIKTTAIYAKVIDQLKIDAMKLLDEV
jgi:integrase